MSVFRSVSLDVQAYIARLNGTIVSQETEIAALKVERDGLREIIRDADDEMVAEVGDRHRASGLGKRMQDALEQSAPNRTDGQPSTD